MEWGFLEGFIYSWGPFCWPYRLLLRLSTHRRPVSGQHYVVRWSLCCLCHWRKCTRISDFHNLIIPTQTCTYCSTECNSDVRRSACGSHVTLQSHVIGLPIKLAFNLICSSRMPAKLWATAPCLMVLYRMLKREWKCCVACQLACLASSRCSMLVCLREETVF